MAEIPNLAGVATQELVDSIGAGTFKASYINWARTMNLLHKHAPGWMAEVVEKDGDDLRKAPVGGYLKIRFVHSDGTVTPSVLQSVMDYRNNSIPFEKITARDITDTHVRGACKAAAFIFGLGYELWAKMPLESGYQIEQGETGQTVEKKPVSIEKGKNLVNQISKSKEKNTLEDFKEKALELGLSTYSIEYLITKLNGKWDVGVNTLDGKSPEWVKETNTKCQPKDNAKKKTAAAGTPKLAASDY